MSMSLKEFGRLKRLMERTTSGTDGERLEAIDHANKMLATHGLTWEKVFGRTVTVVDEVEPGPGSAPSMEPGAAESVDEIFEDLSRWGRRFTGFIGSVHAQWERSRYLHPSALSTLREIHEEERSKRR